MNFNFSLRLFGSVTNPWLQTVQGKLSSYGNWLLKLWITKRMMRAQSKFGDFLSLACVVAGLGASSARAFSLLGPFQPWMEETNDLRQGGVIYQNGGLILPADIGGPMDISNEYRWNVPVLTYGFDQSFLDYFGTNGVAAVDGAIQILNNLPPASQIVLTNFPFDTTHINYEAQSLSLYDLKSETLSLLLEQMGLTQPTRFTIVIPLKLAEYQLVA